MATAATAPSPASAPPYGDGRARRSARSRAAIETALFELVGEGTLQPTVQEVAARAGVAMRSVFRHFSDLESLFASIDARLRLEAAPLVEQAQPIGSVADRVRGMVRLRATIFERIAPYRRSADLQRWRSPFIRRQHHDLVRVLRSGLSRWLPELAAASPDVLEGLELVTSFEAWARLRGEQRLGVARARAVMEGTAMRLVQSRTASTAGRAERVRR
jgi:AcrR family transcriptional regulator